MAIFIIINVNINVDYSIYFTKKYWAVIHRTDRTKISSRIWEKQEEWTHYYIFNGQVSSCVFCAKSEGHWI